MGAWGTGILENDTSADVYSDFFEQYNNGVVPEDVSTDLIKEYQEIIDEPNETSNIWLALALAQWETKSLNKVVLGTVTTLVENGSDIQRWKELGADEDDLLSREKVLSKFLKKINKEKTKAKAKARKKKKEPIFQKRGLSYL